MEKSYQRRQEPVKLLLKHPNKKVRHWAKNALHKIQRMTEEARAWDVKWSANKARFWE